MVSNKSQVKQVKQDELKVGTWQRLNYQGP